MSSRSLAAARAKRAGESAPPVSGNRPGTSIGSHAAFAHAPHPGMGYQMPPPPNNVRVARGQPPPQQPHQYQNQMHPQQPYGETQSYATTPTSNSAMPFTKLSVSDAIGLITLRLGRVEQWILDTEHEESEKDAGAVGALPEGVKAVDTALWSTIVNRLDALEKAQLKQGAGGNTEETSKLLETVQTEVKTAMDAIQKQTVELAKNTTQLFKFNRELTETKDLLKTFMMKYDAFTQETAQNFADYEIALGDLEKRVCPDDDASANAQINGDTLSNEGTSVLQLSPEETTNVSKKESERMGNDNSYHVDQSPKLKAQSLKSLVKEELSAIDM